MLPRIAFILIFTQTCLLRLPYELAVFLCILMWVINIAIRPEDFKNPFYCLLFTGTVLLIAINPPQRKLQTLASPMQFGVSSKQRTLHCPEVIRSKAYWNIYGCALLFGDKSSLPKDLKHSLQEIGMSHILAISGLHFGVMFLTFKIMFHIFFGVFSLITNARDHAKLIYRVQSILLMIICVYYYLLTNRSPASFRACSLLISAEFLKMVGFHIKFLDLLVGVFVFTGMSLGKELLSIGNMLSWSCYLTVYYFHTRRIHPVSKNIYMYSCLSLIGASFFMNFNLLSPIINIVFLPTFILLFSGLILTFMLMNMIDLGDTVSHLVVKQIENYFILLDEWTFYGFRHFHIQIQSALLEALLPLLTLGVLGYFSYKIENQVPRTFIHQ